MTLKRTTIFFAVLTGLFGAHVATATPPSGKITRTELAQGTTRDPISINSSGETAFYVQQVVIDPGGDSGWHTHPGPEYTIVKSGTVTLQRATHCTPVALGPGQVMFIEDGVSHTARNEGTEPVELYVTYTLPAGQMIRHDQSATCAAP